MILESFRGMRSHCRTSQSRAGGTPHIQSLISFETHNMSKKTWIKTIAKNCSFAKPSLTRIKTRHKNIFDKAWVYGDPHINGNHRTILGGLIEKGQGNSVPYAGEFPSPFSHNDYQLLSIVTYSQTRPWLSLLFPQKLPFQYGGLRNSNTRRIAWPRA